MVTVAIIAIIAALAWPAYTRYITRTKRVAAVSCMSQVSSYMERYYTRNMRYDKDADGDDNAIPSLECMSAGNTGQHYGYALSDLTVSTFTITATPTGSQASQDGSCGTMTIDQASQQTITGSGTAAKCFGGGD